MDMKRQNKEYLRAQSMVLQDKFDFRDDAFCKDLNGFLSNYFTFDAVRVDVVEGKKTNLIVCINVDNVKKSRTV